VTATASVALEERYSPADLDVFTPGERRRFAPGAGADPRRDRGLAFELLYRLEPGLYARLAAAERLHPGIIDWFPRHVSRIVEVGAGSGRLTLALADRCDKLVAVEPAAPMRPLLKSAVRESGAGARVEVVDAFFDALPVEDGWADVTVTCSALTDEPAHGGEAGLLEMERVTRPGGMVVVVWPNHLRWLTDRGYTRVVFRGPAAMEFESLDEAVELARVFYPAAAAEVERRGKRVVPYALLGVRGPRDLAYKVVA